MNYFSENEEDFKTSNPFGIEVDLLWRNLPTSKSIIEMADRFKSTCPSAKAGTTAFDVFSISEVEFPYGLCFYAHGHVGEKETFFRLNLDRKPKHDPPPDLMKISDGLEGYPGGQKHVLNSLRGLGGTCDADVRLLFKKSPFKISARKLPKKIGDEIRPFRVDSEVLNLGAKDGARTEITFLKGGALVKVRCDLELEIKEGCFEIACGMLTDKLLPLLKAK